MCLRFHGRHPGPRASRTLDFVILWHDLRVTLWRRSLRRPTPCQTYKDLGRFLRLNGVPNFLWVSTSSCVTPHYSGRTRTCDETRRRPFLSPTPFRVGFRSSSPEWTAVDLESVSLVLASRRSLSVRSWLPVDLRPFPRSRWDVPPFVAVLSTLSLWTTQ